ncbi:MAG: glutamate--cysteine ligase, partial [Pseudomonadota bacterium]|nr:glutamate--cysteine ligase [Pseudomonadota bacterium]
NPGGDYNQLATTLLQIENEFYGTIRPKRVIHPGERPLHALRERGVEYVEVRLMDLDPFEPIGLNADTARMLDIFLLHSLLTDSPPDSPDEIAALARNQHLTAERGRQPGLLLERAGQQVLLADWGAELLAAFAPIADALDAAHGGNAYAQALSAARQAFGEPARLPSARVLHAVQHTHGGSFKQFVREHSLRTRGELLALPYPDALRQHFDTLASESVQAQQRIESTDSVPFETYRREYTSPQRLGLRADALMAGAESP